jgi:hypothetical protein
MTAARSLATRPVHHWLTHSVVRSCWSCAYCGLLLRWPGPMRTLRPPAPADGQLGGDERQRDEENTGPTTWKKLPNRTWPGSAGCAA